MSRPKLTLEIAYNLAEALFNASGERDERLESVIAQDTERAYAYALNVLKGPFPEGEPAIARHLHLAYRYARHVIKRPFPEAELAIAQDPELAFWYARYVLKSSWPEAEFVISKQPFIAYEYMDLLKTPEDIARFKEVQQWSV